MSLPIDPKQGEFLALDVESARKKKFDKGRAEHGPVFKLDPLVELDAEMLDSLNYCDEAVARGHDSYEIDSIRASIYQISCKLRGLIVRDGLIHHDGTKYELPVHYQFDPIRKMICRTCDKVFAGDMTPGCGATVESNGCIDTGYDSKYDMVNITLVSANPPLGAICDDCIDKLVAEKHVVMEDFRIGRPIGNED